MAKIGALMQAPHKIMVTKGKDFKDNYKVKTSVRRDQLKLFKFNSNFFSIPTLILISIAIAISFSPIAGANDFERAKRRDAENWANSGDDMLDVVRLPGGTLRGKRMVSRESRKYYRFSSIPYSQPPQRFQPPEPPLPWEGILDGTKPSPVCPQISLSSRNRVVGSENCLYATVNVPLEIFEENQRASEKAGTAPVLVFIHGGSFFLGSGNDYGAEYLMDQNILFVTLNYRIDSLGFLSTGDGEILGNQGLKDIIQALKWVQINLPFFGGHPGRVTIMGVDSGAALVTCLMLSPLSSGLFTRAIIDSGSILNPTAISQNPGKLARQLADHLNCSTTSTSGLADCLKAKDFKEVILAAEKFRKWNANPTSPFAPVVESPRKGNGAFAPPSALFLSEHPLKLLSAGRILRVPIIVMAMRNEGLGLATELVNLGNERRNANENWTGAAPTMFNYAHLNLPPVESDVISNKIRHFYFPRGRSISEDNLQVITDVYSDRFYLQGLVKTALFFAPLMPVYPLHFSFQGGFNSYLTVYGGKNPKPDQISVGHLDELQYVFRIPYLQDLSAGSESENFSKKFVHVLSSFVHDGVPQTEFASGNSPPWPPVSAAEVQNGTISYFYEVNNEVWNRTKSPFLDRLRFWEYLRRTTGLIEETRIIARPNNNLI